MERARLNVSARLFTGSKGGRLSPPRAISPMLMPALVFSTRKHKCRASCVQGYRTCAAGGQTAVLLRGPCFPFIRALCTRVQPSYTMQAIEETVPTVADTTLATAYRLVWPAAKPSPRRASFSYSRHLASRLVLSILLAENSRPVHRTLLGHVSRLPEERRRLACLELGQLFLQRASEPNTGGSVVLADPMMTTWSYPVLVPLLRPALAAVSASLQRDTLGVLTAASKGQTVSLQRIEESQDAIGLLFQILKDGAADITPELVIGAAEVALVRNLLCLTPSGTFHRAPLVI